MSKKILTKVCFGCTDCKESDLVSVGAVRTEDNTIYFVFQCLNCQNPVYINSDSVAIQLFSAEKSQVN
jgi:hypothetical protein